MLKKITMLLAVAVVFVVPNAAMAHDRHHGNHGLSLSYNSGYHYSPHRYKYRHYRRDYRSRYYNDYRTYRAPACPRAGYSAYRLRGSDCYRHKRHWHCG